MNPFEELTADFAKKMGVAVGGPGTDSIDLEAEGVVVSAQYRPERDDCVIFSLPMEDAIPDATMLRRALELAANGSGTDGHFLGLKEGMFMLSAVLPLQGLSAETFAQCLLRLAAASKRVTNALSGTEEDGGDTYKSGPLADQGKNGFMRV